MTTGAFVRLRYANEIDNAAGGLILRDVSQTASGTKIKASAYCRGFCVPATGIM